jgi:FRG domain.
MNTQTNLTNQEVSSFEELVKELFSDSWNTDLERYRTNYAFRGLPSTNYHLESSLMRLGGKYKTLERHLIRNFRKYAYPDAVQNDSDWFWLSLGQHHGLPTRLLDWTFSPLVALHFATSNINRFNEDGVIWAVNYVETHALLPQKVKEVLQKEGSHLFTVEMLASLFKTLDEFDKLSKSDFLIFYEPPSLDSRIINQYALFSVFSNAEREIDNWLYSHPTLYKKIIIPAKLKWEIRDKLDQFNITERVLFPGLDGLSGWLKRHYSPKN